MDISERTILPTFPNRMPRKLAGLKIGVQKEVEICGVLPVNARATRDAVVSIWRLATQTPDELIELYHVSYEVDCFKIFIGVTSTYPMPSLAYLSIILRMVGYAPLLSRVRANVNVLRSRLLPWEM